MVSWQGNWIAAFAGMTPWVTTPLATLETMDA
jgi:hypothetical protein